MVSDASKKKAAQKKVVSVAVMAAASFKGPDKVANGIAKIQISDWTCTSLQRYSRGGAENLQFFHIVFNLFFKYLRLLQLGIGSTSTKHINCNIFAKTNNTVLSIT
ncbi:hypothetical protein JHK85_002151 [Glycine max]|nr:hypothetical protein JHK85_002151 [Glycine max]